VKIIYKIWGIFYHLYYLFVIALVIILISPFIIHYSNKDYRYAAFFRWSRIWARWVLRLMGFYRKIRKDYWLEEDQQYIICANHTSDLDIMMTLAIVPNCFVFIGKQELAKMPLFGYFYKRTNILVDRSSLKSKKEVMIKAKQKLEEGTGLCIFPEGGILNKGTDLKPFKMGAFKLAIESGIPILPITYPDNRKHFPEFLDGGYPGKLRATIHPPLHTKQLGPEDQKNLRNECFSIIENELKKYRENINTIS